MHCASRSSFHIRKSRHLASASYSIYFHPRFLSFSCYPALPLKQFYYLPLYFEEYFCNLECFRFSLTFQNKNKRSQSISVKGGPLNQVLLLLSQKLAFLSAIPIDEACFVCGDEKNEMIKYGFLNCSIAYTPQNTHAFELILDFR